MRQREETEVPMQEQEVKAARAQPRYNLGFLREKQKLDPLCALITQALNLSQDSNHDDYHEALALLGEDQKTWVQCNEQRFRLNEEEILILEPETDKDNATLVTPECFRLELMQRAHESPIHRDQEGNYAETGEKLSVAQYATRHSALRSKVRDLPEPGTTGRAGCRRGIHVDCSSARRSAHHRMPQNAEGAGRQRGSHDID